jgi:hypothetical protein
MFNPTSALIGVNLALIAHDRKLDLTPKAGSLIDALSQGVKHTFDLYPGAGVESLAGCLQDSAAGTTTYNQGQSTGYSASGHDTLMDNYIVELAQIVGHQVNFARQVVYTKIKHLEDAVRGAFQQYPIKEAEDFFTVSFYQQPDLFKSYLVQDEVKTTAGQVSSPEIVNFGEVLTQEFDVSSYFVTGDEEIDRLIQDWIAKTGKDTILSYLSPKSANFETSLFGPAAMDFYMANFLLFRQLAIKQDLSVGLSAIQMSTVTATNRDYYAGQLAFHLVNHAAFIRQGRLLTMDSQTKFSYLSSTKFSITIYEESFAELKDESDALEKIFGSIARYGANDLSVETVKTQGADFLYHWKNVRSLYTAYLVSSRSQLLKSSLKLMLASSIDLDCEEDKDSPLFDEAYRTQSVQMACDYIDCLQASDADDLYKVCMEVMGRIIYRFSNAYFFIREMYEILQHDDEISAQDATHAASVRYITDFLLEQIDCGQRVGV